MHGVSSEIFGRGAWASGRSRPRLYMRPPTKNAYRCAGVEIPDHVRQTAQEGVLRTEWNGLWDAVVNEGYDVRELPPVPTERDFDVQFPRDIMVGLPDRRCIMGQFPKKADHRNDERDHSLDLFSRGYFSDVGFDDIPPATLLLNSDWCIEGGDIEIFYRPGNRSKPWLVVLGLSHRSTPRGVHEAANFVQSNPRMQVEVVHVNGMHWSTYGQKIEGDRVVLDASRFGRGDIRRLKKAGLNVVKIPPEICEAEPWCPNFKTLPDRKPSMGTNGMLAFSHSGHCRFNEFLRSQKLRVVEVDLQMTMYVTEGGADCKFQELCA